MLSPRKTANTEAFITIAILACILFTFMHNASNHEQKTHNASMITENMRIIENRELKSSYHLLRLKSDKIAPRSAGQFVHIRIPTE